MYTHHLWQGTPLVESRSGASGACEGGVYCEPIRLLWCVKTIRDQSWYVNSFFNGDFVAVKAVNKRLQYHWTWNIQWGTCIFFVYTQAFKKRGASLGDGKRDPSLTDISSFFSFLFFNVSHNLGTSTNNGGLSNPKCGEDFSVPLGEGRSFFCRPSLYGRYVTIGNLLPKKHITLCEVEVYSARRSKDYNSLCQTLKTTVKWNPVNPATYRPYELSLIHGEGLNFMAGFLQVRQT